MSEKQSLGSGDNSKIDLSHVPNGIYFMHVHHGELIEKKQILIEH